MMARVDACGRKRLVCPGGLVHYLWAPSKHNPRNITWCEHLHDDRWPSEDLHRAPDGKDVTCLDCLVEEDDGVQEDD